MRDKITIKQNDNGIGLRATLSNNSGFVNLTGTEVFFFVGNFQIPATIVDAAAGEVQVVFESTHTAKPGSMNGEFEVRYSDGRKETFPNEGYVRVDIAKGIGG